MAFLDVQVEEAEAEAEKFADKPGLLIADKPVLSTVSGTSGIEPR